MRVNRNVPIAQGFQDKRIQPVGGTLRPEASRRGLSAFFVRWRKP